MALTVTIRTGEHLWTARGTHAMDERGKALRASTETEVTFDSQEAHDRAVKSLNEERARYRPMAAAPARSPVTPDPPFASSGELQYLRDLGDRVTALERRVSLGGGGG